MDYSPTYPRLTTAALALLCWLIASPLFASPPAQSGRAKPCEYTDLMPAYLKFARRTADLPPTQRATAFRSDIAAHYSDYYAPEAFGDDSKLQASAVKFFARDKHTALFPGTHPLTDEHLAEIGRVIGPEFVRQQARFMATFQDFQCQAVVEFGVSLLHFDGHPLKFGGKEHLLFGVDLIAALHDASDMSSFFDHEIFHIYHRPLIARELPEGGEPAWITMWTEGLATYVSQRMNPGLDAQQVLWFPRDMVSRMKVEGARAAALLLRDLDKTDREGHRWFLMGTQVEGLPDRAGYYLGYLFAKSVGDGVDLRALARMPLHQVHEEEQTFLKQLARQ